MSINRTRWLDKLRPAGASSGGWIEGPMAPVETSDAATVDQRCSFKHRAGWRHDHSNSKLCVALRMGQANQRNKKFFEENKTNAHLQTLFKMTQHRTMRKPKNASWSITGDFIYRHHVEHRVKLYMPKEESFHIPMKYIDVTRTTHTSLDVLWENRWMITGTWMEKENYLMHGQASQDSFY